MFNLVITTLGKLPGDASHYIQARDWERLAAILPTRNTDVQVATIRHLFYPSKAEQDSNPTAPGTRRHTGFLEALDDKGYRAFYEFLIESPYFTFPDVHKLLRTPKGEGQMMMDVMTHVVRWVNPDSAVLSDRRKSNKPLLREGLIPNVELLTAPGPGNDERANTERAERQSILLERQVLEFVRRRMDDLKHPATKAYLDVVPDNTEQGGGDYAERFADKFWKDLLYIVKVFLGPRFQPWWITGTPDRQSSPIDSQVTHSTITRALCTLAQRVPEVAENPALNSKEAFTQLAAAIDGAVTQWVADRCQQALDNSNSQSERPSPVETRQPLESARKKHKHSLLVESPNGGIIEKTDPKDERILAPPPPPSLASTKFSGFSSTPELDPSPWVPPGPEGESPCDDSRGESQHNRERGAETGKQRYEGAESSLRSSLEAINKPRRRPLEAAEAEDEDARKALVDTRDSGQPQTTLMHPTTRQAQVAHSRKTDSSQPRKALPLAAPKRKGSQTSGGAWKRGLTATSST